MSTPADYINPGISGYNIYRGATSGNPVGQARAGLGAANLYGRLSGNMNVNTGATGALDALNIYQGVNQGGWQGYGKAGSSALQLAGMLSSNPALSALGGYVAAPLALYNFGENWRSGATGADALSGAETGAEIGSIIPGIGTVIGGLVGGAAGALSSAFGPGAKDPETAGVQGLLDYTGSHGNNQQIAANDSNPYLDLAGLMDRRSSTLPMYSQYGRMGEQKFTDDLTKQINEAFTSGQGIQTGALKGDVWSRDDKGDYVLSTPTGGKTIYDPSQGASQVYNSTVDPWVEGMGSGYKNVGDTYTATTQGLLKDMTSQYLSGQAADAWKSVGGQSPFSDIYQGSPLAGAQQTYNQQVAQQQAVQQAQQQAQASANLRHREQMKAKGGHIQNRLRHLYAGSFANRKRHFDDGGGVGSYYDSPGYTQPPSDASTIDPSQFYTPTQGDVSNSLDAANQEGVDTINNPYGSGPASSGGTSGSSGVLSSLGNLLGVSSMGQLIQKYGALAPLLTAALGKNKPASAPATPAGYGAIPSIATPANKRAYTPPNVANWYTYGQGPEASFFSNNQLPTVPGVSPGTSPAGAGQMTTQPVSSPVQGSPTPPILRARGGTFDSTAGDDYVPDPGHGDGTSDDIDAKLSGGEYVMDAGTVSMLGNGSNEAGSRALDQLRKRVRKHAGKQLVKGKQFMKAKAPEKYLAGQGGS